MPKTLTMIDPRPNGSGGDYERGKTYTLADDIADYFLSIGVARYPTLQQSDVIAGRDPSTGAVSTIGTGRDPLGAPVVAVTGPGGGIEFPGVSQLTAAVRNAVQYIVSNADLESRPPRLRPIDAVQASIYNADSMYAYGFAKTNQAQFVRIHLITRELTNGHNFGAGYIIDDVFTGHGVVLVSAAEVATGRRWLYRSTDQGATFSAVHQLGISQDGSQHNPLVKILAKGLDFGELNGAPAIMFATYNYSATTRGSVTDQDYIAISVDNGVTWQRLATFNVGKNSVQHFHVCQWDMYRMAWWVASGDADDESMIVRWDGVTPWPGDKSPVEMAATPGFTVGYGRQRYRTTGLIFTSDWIYSMTDSVGDNEGGIWRFRGDLSEFHRVDHKVKSFS